MNISEVFIRRPIATSLLMLAVALFGVLAYRGLAVSDLPSVDFPTLQVSASLPGASPETMASAVATPLERQFTGIAGVDSMISASGTGSTSITLQFSLDRDIEGAAVDVQTAIAEVLPLLPPGMPSPPSFRKSNPADFPIIFLSVTSPTMPLYELDEYAETRIAQRLSMVSGVAQVQVFGSQKYAVRVQIDPDKLASRKIALNEVSQALQDWNVNLPTGTLYGPNTAYNVQASGQLMHAPDYRSLVVAYRDGAPVRLQEVGRVIDSVEDDKTLSMIYTKDTASRAITLAVMRQPGSNTIEVTDQVKRLIPTFEKEIPPSVHLVVRGDRSKNIREAFSDIQFTMLATLMLVILVIFLFLRNGSATAIPAMALPFSVVGTFAVMYLLDFSLNNVSMMALILCIGFVVDDAIVMLENIVRHMESGETPLQASLRGSREIGFTILSMTISLAAVFIPLLFMGGILGRLFREFAVTICAAILISGMVSISLTPMLCSRFLKPPAEMAHGVFYRVTEGFFRRLNGFYERSLGWVLHHRPVMLAVFFLVLGATGYLFVKVPKGFIPDQDNDSLSVTVEAAQGTSYYQMVRYLQRVAEVMRRDPNIDTFFLSAGGGFNASASSSRVMVQLKPRRQRTQTVFQVVDELRPKLGGFPGVRVFATVPPSIRVGGRMSKSQFDFTLQSPDTTELYRQAAKFERVVARLPGLVDVTSDLQVKNPRVNVTFDRDKAAALGLNVLQVAGTLYSAFGPRWASTIYAPTSQNRVLLELMPEYQAHPDTIPKLYFKSPDGNLAPFDAFGKMYIDAGPLTINHSGQLPSATVSFNLAPGVALGDAVDEIQTAALHELPANITTSFQGTAKAFQDSLRNMSLLLLVAVMVVYIVLGILYESYIHPLTILSGLPSAGFGALLTLLIFKVDLSLYAFVGLIMLIGIVKKNAIMQIDFALEAERRHGKNAREAILEGCMTRFRPIMMTTMAALLGALPISLGYGSGGEARRPLGLTIIGGLLFSQLMTLYLTPVIYTYMDAVQAQWKEWRGRSGARAITPAVESKGFAS
jgi:hydrophobic/amphiphilic exporter-1 (mainly G- bacteria), HAE1 family